MCMFFAAGCENDCQIDGIAKMAPIVAFYAGKPDMLEKVEQAVRVTQNNDACVAETLAAARSVGFPIQTHKRLQMWWWNKIIDIHSFRKYLSFRFWNMMIYRYTKSQCHAFSLSPLMFSYHSNFCYQDKDTKKKKVLIYKHTSINIVKYIMKLNYNGFCWPFNTHFIKLEIPPTK